MGLLLLALLLSRLQADISVLFQWDITTSTVTCSMPCICFCFRTAPDVCLKRLTSSLAVGLPMALHRAHSCLLHHCASCVCASGNQHCLVIGHRRSGDGRELPCSKPLPAPPGRCHSWWWPGNLARPASQIVQLQSRHHRPCSLTLRLAASSSGPPLSLDAYHSQCHLRVGAEQIKLADGRQRIALSSNCNTELGFLSSACEEVGSMPLGQ